MFEQTQRIVKAHASCMWSKNVRSKSPASPPPLRGARVTSGKQWVASRAFPASDLDAVFLGVALELRAEVAFGRTDGGADPTLQLVGLEAQHHRLHRADRGGRHGDGAIAEAN